MKRHFLSFFLLVPLCALLFAACSMKKYCPAPKFSLPQNVLRDRSAIDSMAMADLQWWQIYTDTLLQQLIRKTLANNKDMQAAISKIKQLRYGNRAALAENFPNFSLRLGGDYERTHHYQSPVVPDPEPALRGSISWEYNLFGAQAWATRQERDKYLASIEGQRALQMSLIAQIATAYFELISFDRQLEIVKRTIAIRRENMEKIHLRFTGGLTSEIVYHQAIVEYLNAATLIPDIEKNIRLKENEISLLSGEFPSRIERSDVVLESMQWNEVPVGLPADLLLRRPDIRQSRAQLDAAMAKAGFYFANRFPSIRIGFEPGFENTQWAHIFRSPHLYFVGNMLVPLLAFGKRHHQYKASLEEYIQQKAVYEKKVLTAFKEVNDAMVIYTNATQNSALLLDLHKAAQKYAELSEIQYINGVISYLDVLDAQRRYFNAQLGLTRSVCEEYITLVNLYKALGGGWNTEIPEDALTKQQLRKQERSVRHRLNDSVADRPGLDPQESFRSVYRESLGKDATEKTERLIRQDFEPESSGKGRKKNR